MNNLLDLFDKMPVLHSQKNAALACLLGILFGSIGLGLYFKSFEDFVICTVVIMLLLLTIPGIGILLAAFLVGAYGYFRVINSNERL